MSRREFRVRLLHMLAHAKEAAEMALGKSRSDLHSDRQLNLALVRLLEIVGEAATQIPKQERELWPDVPLVGNGEPSPSAHPRL